MRKFIADMREKHTYTITDALVKLWVLVWMPFLEITSHYCIIFLMYLVLFRSAKELNNTRTSL